MSKIRIILVGGGGHCKSCIEAIESAASYQIEGILDLPEKLNERILGYPVVGNDKDITHFVRSGCKFLITTGQIKTAAIRKKIFSQIKLAGGICETIVASTARVSKYAQLGEGTIIMHQAFVNAGAKIGENCIVNTSAVVEHDVIVGDHTHISTMAVINGGAIIGSGSFVGSNSVVNHGINISNEIVIGSGSIVNKDIVDIGIYAGNPFKKISR